MLCADEWDRGNPGRGPAGVAFDSSARAQASFASRTVVRPWGPRLLGWLSDLALGLERLSGRPSTPPNQPAVLWRIPKSHFEKIVRILSETFGTLYAFNSGVRALSGRTSGFGSGLSLFSKMS